MLRGLGIDGEPDRPNGRRDYARFVKTITNRGNWHPTPRAWLPIFGYRGTSVLMHLLTNGQATANADGWIHATASFIRCGLSLSDEAERRSVNKLKRLGVIEAMGVGSKRRLRVVIDRIKALERQVLDAA